MFNCVEAALDETSSSTSELKSEAPQEELKDGHGHVLRKELDTFQAQLPVFGPPLVPSCPDAPTLTKKARKARGFSVCRTPKSLETHKKYGNHK